MTDRTVFRTPIAAAYIATLDEERRLVLEKSIQRLLKAAQVRPSDGDMTVDGSDNVLIARHDIEKGAKALLIHVRDAARHRVLEAVRQHQPEETPLTREKAASLVEEGLGRRPDLPPGTEYVRRVSWVWRGLIPGAERPS